MIPIPPYFENVLVSLREIELSGWLDIGFLTLLIYGLLVWFRRTNAIFILRGIAIFACIYLIARHFNLALTTAFFEKFFGVILIALIVIFQEELRHFFEQIAVWSFNPHLASQKKTRLLRPEIELLARTVKDLAREKRGALIVLKGREMIARYLDGGEELDGRMSEALLKSLFDPHSEGHDGALVISGDRITQFACHLPLSKNLKKLHGVGTRHAAALGLSELTDALCLVVSEERGTISIAWRGELKPVQNPETLVALLQKFYGEVAPSDKKKPWLDFLFKDLSQKLGALFFAALLWFVLVHGSKMTYKTFTVPVQPPTLPQNLTLQSMVPGEVTLTFSGQRSAFYFINARAIKLFPKTLNLGKGKRVLNISHSDVVFPKHLVLEDIAPPKVTLQIEEKLPNFAKDKS